MNSPRARTKLKTVRMAEIDEIELIVPLKRKQFGLRGDARGNNLAL